ncbi:MAG: beta-ketoacyl-[acyl-carrier-protein] synthase family protein [Nitrospirae bacterium]|nr:beta-ketoacyl-[acyl-carrier-protein] synthase family protein [Nitrospirota bacterium]MBF0535635.1 beta-ketoacyl-[acyl-carrier-protein] synthase family protein [Nitrospirota bacterium]MBF0616941.1 beta-ketoacyl-[acyl-carrier-protein] synthase family protein [Nitrospirota bacterium]
MNTEHKKRRIVVTGYGMITPLGVTANETFENALQGRSGIREITNFDTRGLPCTVGGEVNGSWNVNIKDINSEIDVKRLEKYVTRGSRFMIGATDEALKRAKLSAKTIPESAGVALGFHGENPVVSDMVFLHRFYDGKGGWDIEGLRNKGGYSYFNFFRRKSDVGSTLLSALFNCKGPNLAIASACAAGSQAIGEACAIIKSGATDVMIAGGCESSLNFTGFIGFVLIKALVEKYSSPEKASRPFDRKRNGFVMSEGAGAVILEELSHAKKRGADIYAEIKGFGSSADAYRITDMHPKGEGAVIAMRAALEDASLTPADIEYINAHGTSTLQNDATETVAIKEVFGSLADSVLISSNKSMLGHTIAAAGAIECVLSIMGINSSTILPTINYEFPDPKCNLNYVPNTALERQHSYVLSNSFGFGGQNASLCIGATD